MISLMFSLKVAQTHTPIMCLLAVQLTAERPALDQLDHDPRGRGAAWLVTLRRSQAVQPDRHIPELDRVAVP